MSQHILDKALRNAKQSMRRVFAFSFVANVLLLTSPLFMLQVYDRVLISRSEETLLALFSVACFALLILVGLEISRNALLTRISMRFDQEVGQATVSELLKRSAVTQPLHDLNTVRQFLSSPFVLALFDMPWMPLYLGLVYMLHPMLGHVGLVAAVILFLLAVVNDRATRFSSQQSGQYFSSANRFIEHSVNNKDATIGLGMVPMLEKQWRAQQLGGLGYQARAADVNTRFSSFAKVFRQFIQVAILATGAYLTIQDLSTAGVMIAASIITARALAPIEQSIQGWRSLSKCKESYANLHEFLASYEQTDKSTQLPKLEGKLALSNVFAYPQFDSPEQGAGEPLIRNISMTVQPGSTLGIAGASGSGKSTLMRLMVGVVKPFRGSVRIDGAELTPDVHQQFSSSLGYLPQDVELFDGTIAENIARFGDAEDEKIVEAAQLAGAHELILSFPEGYQTRVGPSGLRLSGGQRQRVGFARALYGNPRLVFLDEPSSNLDELGTQSLLRSLHQLKQAKVTVIIIAHQPRLFLLTDYLLVLNQGTLEKFGPTKEVLAELKPPEARETKPRVTGIRASNLNEGGK